MIPPDPLAPKVQQAIIKVLTQTGELPKLLQAGLGPRDIDCAAFVLNGTRIVGSLMVIPHHDRITVIDHDGEREVKRLIKRDWAVLVGCIVPSRTAVMNRVVEQVLEKYPDATAIHLSQDETVRRALFNAGLAHVEFARFDGAGYVPKTALIKALQEHKMSHWCISKAYYDAFCSKTGLRIWNLPPR